MYHYWEEPSALKGGFVDTGLFVLAYPFSASTFYVISSSGGGADIIGQALGLRLREISSFGLQG